MKHPSDKIYTVFVDSHAHYMDRTARRKLAAFLHYETAVTAAQKIVDESLLSLYVPGMTAENLFKTYSFFGKDPFIVPDDVAPSFSAWSYAQVRCQVICIIGEQ